MVLEKLELVFIAIDHHSSLTLLISKEVSSNKREETLWTIPNEKSSVGFIDILVATALRIIGIPIVSERGNLWHNVALQTLPEGILTKGNFVLHSLNVSTILYQKW